MIRHSSSFFISFIVHTALAVLLFYTYKNVISFENKTSDKVEIKLNCIVEKKADIKPLNKPEEKIKTLPLKPKPIAQKTAEKIERNKPPAEEEKPDEKIEPNNKSSVLTEDSSPEQDYIDKHLKEIVKLLQENLYYPRSARKRGITGEVTVKFGLSMDATVNYIKVLSANSDILSRAAVKTIEDLSGKFPKPDKELILNVPIKYSLSH